MTIRPALRDPAARTGAGR